MKTSFSLTLALLAALCLGGPASAEEVMDLPLEVLAADYNANELAADLKYKGKKIRLMATFDQISRSHDFGDTPKRPYAAFYDSRSGDVVRVECFFDGDQMTALAPALDSLVNQRPLTLVCAIAGMEYSDLKLEGCVIEPLPTSADSR